MIGSSVHAARERLDAGRVPSGVRSVTPKRPSARLDQRPRKRFFCSVVADAGRYPPPLDFAACIMIAASVTPRPELPSPPAFLCRESRLLHRFAMLLGKRRFTFQSVQ